MPKIWALADLHLSLSTPEKTMEVFGPEWNGYIERMKENWCAVVTEEDLVLLPGDISWAMKLSQMEKDLEWIDSLPGQKMLIRGNHDYWWGSLSKMRKAFPASIQIVHQNAYLWNGIAIGGSRLWDTPEVSLEGISDYKPPEKSKEQLSEEARIFEREIERLERSLKEFDPKAEKRIVMTHYPPIGLEGKSTRVSKLFKEYQVDIVVFGHLHKLYLDAKIYDQTFDGIRYDFVAADYLEFKPKLIYSPYAYAG
jgi:uncharacterized protein